ncbi:MAG TPA: ribonuclease R, partial [Alphaproteobacteria bacterium]|nr:ribonuclease R [Alphaproteobacteria bacterium]
MVEIDAEEGEAIAHPLEWRGDGKPPLIRLKPAAGEADLAIGERALVRLERTNGLEFIGSVIRRVERAPERVLAVLVAGPHGARLQPTDKRIRGEFALESRNAKGAQPGDLVLAEVLPGHRLGIKHARVIERLGSSRSPKTASLIAIHAHDIPTKFSDAALAEAERVPPAPMDNRVDLRDLSLVTIDGEDARDFDDAVFAEPDGDPVNRSGFHIVVAIADVAWYVRPDRPLDREARRRGNSAYFPDRVVPMLPERLSNDLCSLRPLEDRPCLAVHVWIDANGRKLRHRFVRAMMRSQARITYDEAQATWDGTPRGAAAGLRDRVLAPLYGAFHALSRARRARGTLDLDLEERKVVLGPDGRIERIVPRPRYDSHRLIEEFMILANVCAAETLEERKLTCMYRVHDTPDPAKLDALRIVLSGLDFRLAKGQVLKPQHFNRILDWAAGTPNQHLVNQLVLRTQSLAVYSPDNRGHFGLALRRYAHFTSPIRRYADLLVHRALITGLTLGRGGLDDGPSPDFAATAEHVSATERRAAAAEREALDRYVAAWLEARVGAEFSARVSGVTRFGLFVSLEGLGADGLIPIRSLPGDFYHHDAERHVLRGRRSGRSFTLGQPVTVRLVEATPVTGGLRFELVGLE